MIWALAVALAPAFALDGVVRVRGSGDPLADAVVEAPGVAPAVTGKDGRFSLDLAPGTWTLTARAQDYGAEVLRVVVPADRPVVFFLAYAPPDEVIVEATRPSPHVSRQILDRERVEETPGTYGDPIRLIQSLPGVAQTREFSPGAGDVVLRGAAPGESRFYLDGVEIPYLYHFQQYASVIHTRLLDEVAVYPSTFGPAYGDALGGVVAVQTRPADAAILHGGLDVNLITSGAYVSTPLKPAVAVAASARRSYLDFIESANDQYTAWPVFWDYQARTDLRFGADHRLTLSAVGAGDQYGRYVGNTATLDPLEQAENPAFDFDRAFHMGTIQAHDTFSNARLDTVAAVVLDDWRVDLGDEGQNRKQIYGYVRHEATLFQSEHYQLSTGGEAKLAKLSLQANPSQAWFALKREAPLLARGLAVDESLSRLQGGIWLEPRIHVGRLTIQPGGRLQGDSASHTFAVDPRLTLQAALSDALRLRGAVGRYTAAPPLDALSPTVGDPNLGLGSSWSAAAGVDCTVAGRLELSLDGWGRLTEDTVVETVGEAPSLADGFAYGAELSSRYRLRDRFFFWSSLSLSHAEYNDAPFDDDQPVAFSLVGSWKFRPGWNAGLRYRIASGLPYTPVEGGIYDGATDSYTAVLGEVNSVRMPLYQKVDLHLERAWAFRRWTLVAYGELWWIPPGAGVLYPTWSYDYSQTALVEGPPVLPLVGMRVDL